MKIRHITRIYIDRIVNQLLRALAWPLSRVLPLYVREPFRIKYFSVWENRGFHLSPVHFYEPMPDTRTLSDPILEQESELIGIDMRDSAQLYLLDHVLPQFAAEYAEIPREPAGDSTVFYLNNGFFYGADALVYYGMLRHLQPHLVVEVGSGFSSRLAARAFRRNGRGEIVCIEPNPDEGLRTGFAGLKLIQRSVLEIDFDTFGELCANDILFIDSSHIVKCGSDVNRLLLEVIPRLNRGVVVHFHDIFLPRDYGKAWVTQRRRFFTEQYLLQAFLAFNSDFQVLFANHYMALKYPAKMAALFPNWSGFGSSSFWIERSAESRGSPRTSDKVPPHL